MERGLRQGDLISPFLFVLATEAFNKMMKTSLDMNLIQGLKVAQSQVSISHLKFPDDTLTFCPAKRRILSNIRRLLDCFQLLSCLNINFSKSGLIVLGKERDWGEQMAVKLGCQLVQLPIPYLGIPLGANTTKVST